jgi:preprotein translocase subunit SecG
MLRLILTCVQVFTAFAIVGLVLLQRGKGAEAGAGFGAGASGTVFGARGATTALSRATAVFAAIFMVNSLALAYLGAASTKREEAQKTILDEAASTRSKTAPGAGTVPPAAGTVPPAAGTVPPAAGTSAPASPPAPAPSSAPGTPPPAPAPK